MIFSRPKTIAKNKKKFYKNYARDAWEPLKVQKSSKKVTNFYRFLLKKIKEIFPRILIKVYDRKMQKYDKKCRKKVKKIIAF
jgi:hypothetical protein